jgi:NitT/TauT family transport system ATP-binding protein
MVVAALHDVSLRVEPQEFVSLVGPSGCGKSTLLKILAGLLEPTSGTVTIDSDPVQGPRRSVGIMFQTPELFEWRTVLQNVLLPIEIFKHSKDFHTRRARDLLALVGLSEFADAYPRELSGGMQQRTALCRVLVADPSIILMDEPFGALDEFTRERLNLELLRVWDDERKTVVFVTHNIGEAVFLSDRVAVMTSGPGRLVSVIDSPLPRPRTTRMVRSPEFSEAVFEVRKLLGLEQ